MRTHQSTLGSQAQAEGEEEGSHQSTPPSHVHMSHLHHNPISHIVETVPHRPPPSNPASSVVQETSINPPSIESNPGIPVPEESTLPASSQAQPPAVQRHSLIFYGTSSSGGSGSASTGGRRRSRSSDDQRNILHFQQQLGDQRRQLPQPKVDQQDDITPFHVEKATISIIPADHSPSPSPHSPSPSYSTAATLGQPSTTLSTLQTSQLTCQPHNDSSTLLDPDTLPPSLPQGREGRSQSQVFLLQLKKVLLQERLKLQERKVELLKRKLDLVNVQIQRVEGREEEEEGVGGMVGGGDRTSLGGTSFGTSLDVDSSREGSNGSNGSSDSNEEVRSRLANQGVGSRGDNQTTSPSLVQEVRKKVEDVPLPGIFPKTGTEEERGEGCCTL